MRGFTLVEILVALVVIAVGMFALGSFQTDTLRNTGLNKQRTAALALAQERLDALRDFAHAAEVEAIASGSDTRTVDGIAFTRSWTVQPQADGSLAIALQVTWPGPDGTVGADTTVTLNTVVSNYLADTEATAVLGSGAPTATLSTTTTTSGCSGGGGMMGGGCGGGMM